MGSALLLILCEKHCTEGTLQTLPYFLKCDVISAMLEGKNNTFSLPWEIRSIFMQNCFHCFSPPTWLPWKPSIGEMNYNAPAGSSIPEAWAPEKGLGQTTKVDQGRSTSTLHMFKGGNLFRGRIIMLTARYVRQFAVRSRLVLLPFHRCVHTTRPSATFAKDLWLGRFNKVGVDMVWLDYWMCQCV